MRTVLVTGSSRGIGLAITQLLVAQQHQVIGVSRSNTFSHPLFTHHPLDLMELGVTAKKVTQLAQNHTIDAVICNAGEGLFGSIENFSPEQIERNLRLNLISPLVVARSVIPELKKRQRSDIVFIGSESALSGGRFGSVYSAAKFGLRGATQALRHECSSSNCHVGIVHPGMVRTDFFEQLQFEPGTDDSNALLAEDVAHAVLSLLKAADNSVIDEITLNPLKHVVRKKTS